MFSSLWMYISNANGVTTCRFLAGEQWQNSLLPVSWCFCFFLFFFYACNYHDHHWWTTHRLEQQTSTLYHTYTCLYSSIRKGEEKYRLTLMFGQVTHNSNFQCSLSRLPWDAIVYHSKVYLQIPNTIHPNQHTTNNFHGKSLSHYIPRQSTAAGELHPKAWTSLFLSMCNTHLTIKDQRMTTMSRDTAVWHGQLQPLPFNGSVKRSI